MAGASISAEAINAQQKASRFETQSEVQGPSLSNDSRSIAPDYAALRQELLRHLR